ncbi:hypothetical protein [Streptomyces sp. NPDC127098]|uniref:hypothetical protein n=1 Tax=Streptomyces sp. NPDC127098 TaxID=3347137 RepID=UPI00365998A1
MDDDPSPPATPSSHERAPNLPEPDIATLHAAVLTALSLIEDDLLHTRLPLIDLLTGYGEAILADAGHATTRARDVDAAALTAIVAEATREPPYRGKALATVLAMVLKTTRAEQLDVVTLARTRYTSLLRRHQHPLTLPRQLPPPRAGARHPPER